MKESDPIEFNLKLRIWAEKYINWPVWTPVDGALLLSGLNPGGRWAALNAHDWGSIHHLAISGLVHDAEHSGNRPIEASERAPLFNKQSKYGRRSDVSTILAKWNDYCAEQQEEGVSVSTELAPIKFIGWWWEYGNEYGDGINLRDSTYFDAFLDLGRAPIPTKNSNYISYDLICRITPNGPMARHSHQGKKHDLFNEILLAQRDAFLRGVNPYSAKELLPVIVELLQTKKAGNATFISYVADESLQYRRGGEVITKSFESFSRYLRAQRARDKAR